MGQRLVITEDEKLNIRQMYNLNNQSYIFESPHITIDGKYVIFNDELYDYSNNESLGDIFTINNLKRLFENISPDILKENLVLVENVKTELSKVIENEKLLMESVKHSIKNNLILEQNAFAENIIGKGVLWFARKVKSVLWSIGGMAVDAFLVASGIGKTVQWIPWAICFALDVYEWTTGDYGNPEDKNSSPIWKALTIGFDIMGMVTAGAMAKGAAFIMKPLRGLKTEAEIGKALVKSPKALKIVENINKSLGSVSGRFNQLIAQMSQKMPKLASWLKTLTGGVNKIITWISELLGKILGFAGKSTEKIGRNLQAASIKKGNTFGKYLSKIGDKGLERNVGKGLKSATNTGIVMGGVTGGIYGVDKIREKHMNDILMATVSDPNFRL